MPFPKRNVRPHSVSQHVHRSGRFGSPGVGVYPHGAEIVRGGISPLRRPRDRAPHDPIRHPVGFSFVHVPRPTYGGKLVPPGRHPGVYRHPAEVVTEARLHEVAGGRVQRPAGRADHLVYDGRDGGGLGLARGAALKALFAALRTLTVRT
jgi:hypothetical protein